MSRAAERARACFRLANDPGTTQGERDAAKRRGMAILERNSLDPDDFDVPGRERPQKTNPQASGRVYDFGPGARGPGMATFTMEDLVRQAAGETMARRQRARDLPKWYWMSGGQLFCKHGPILYGTRCVQCERERAQTQQTYSQTATHAHQEAVNRATQRMRDGLKAAFEAQMAEVMRSGMYADAKAKAAEPEPGANREPRPNTRHCRHCDIWVDMSAPCPECKH